MADRYTFESIFDNGDDLLELSEEEIRVRCNVKPDFMVKKWRYSRVKTGVSTLFCKITDRMLVAGDDGRLDGVDGYSPRNGGGPPNRGWGSRH